MRSVYLTGALATAIILAGCGERASTGQAPEAAADAAGSPAMGDGEAAQAKSVKSSGTVTAIDKAAGTITLDHQPIPEVRWPAMTMVFSATPEVIGTVAVGDKVAFAATITGNAGQVTAVTVQ